MDSKSGYNPNSQNQYQSHQAGGANESPSAPPPGAYGYNPNAPLYPTVPAESAYTSYGDPPPYQPTTGQSGYYMPQAPLASTSSYGSTSTGYPPQDYHHFAPPPQQTVQPMLTRTTHRVVHRNDSDDQLTCIVNLLWFTIGGGFVFAIAYGLVGLFLCITVIGIPFGLQLFKLAGLSVSAYGRRIERSPDNQTGCNICFNILWLPLGLCLAGMHFVYGCIMFCSLIGIPFALAHWRLMVLAVWPFGAELHYSDDIAYVTTQTTSTTTAGGTTLGNYNAV